MPEELARSPKFPNALLARQRQVRWRQCRNCFCGRPCDTSTGANLASALLKAIPFQKTTCGKTS
jgi:hypothetical protein